MPLGSSGSEELAQRSTEVTFGTLSARQQSDERVPGTAPAVSVVIPTYNRAALLRRALDSVRAQTFTNWEAIVVDDYSEDETEQVVASFEDPRIRLVRFRSAGVIAASRNYGIRLAHAPIVAFLDSDDAWYPDKLRRCLEAMTPDVDLVAHGLVYVKDGSPWKRKRSGPAHRATYRRLLYDGNCLTTSAVVVRKAWLDRIGAFIEDPAELIRDLRRGRILKEGGLAHVGSEDYDLWLRLAQAGARFAFVDEMLGEYHLHTQNSSRAPMSLIDSQLAVLERHFSQIPVTSVWERLRRQRRRALVYYSIARSLQDDGRYREAVSIFRHGLSEYPLIPKLVVAATAAAFLAASARLFHLGRRLPTT